MQQTLGIVPFNTKGDILSTLKNDLVVVIERKFELSIDIASTVFHKEIKESQIACGFILEGMNAIQDWLNTISHLKKSVSFHHGSLNLDNSIIEIDWFQTNILQNSKSLSSSSLSSSIPIMVNTTTVRKNVVKKPTTTATKGSSVSHQKKRDTTLSDDEPRLKSISNGVRSKIPNAKATTPTNMKTARTIPPSSNKTPTTVPRSRLTSNAPPNTTNTTTSRRSELSSNITSSRRKSLVTTTITGTASTTKKLSTTAKGGVSKNTPPTSIITGRTRKYSKLTEKKPVINTIKPKRDTPVDIKNKNVEKEKENNEIPEVTQHQQQEVEVVEKKEEEKQEDEAIVIVDQDIETIHEEEEIKEEKASSIMPLVDQDIITDDQDTPTLQHQPVPHPSTCSSADEHDAEVAATTSNQNSNTVKVAANFFQNSGRSSSFSPNSVTSLPRPETPEVDQLRQRFETIIQTSSPISTIDSQQFRRPSSKMSYEFISRIKEMKPKDPVGSKVKSMVELFMDENLNKWEF